MKVSARAVGRALAAAWKLAAFSLLALFVAELGWRATSGWRLEKREKRQLQKPPQERVGYTLHPFFQMANPPEPRTDAGPLAFGWRVDPPFAKADPNAKTILFLGGSTTATEYPHLVRAKLEPQLGPVTAVNMGFSWHTSLHSLYKLWTYVERLEPDLIVVLHAINDFYRGFTSPKYSLPQYHPDYSHYSGPLSSFWSVGRARGDGRAVFYAQPLESVSDVFERPDPGVSSWLRRLAESSELLRSLRGPQRAGRPSQGGAGQRMVEMPEALYLRALPDFERNMRALRDGCELERVPVLFLTMPFVVDVDTKTFVYPAALFTNDGVEHLAHGQFVEGMKRFNAAVLALNDGRNAWTLDLAAQIVDPALFGDEVHLEPDGLELEAQLVAARILELGLLDGR